MENIITNKKFIVAITGASGAIYAYYLLHNLNKLNFNNNVSVIFSDNAKLVWELELNKKYDFNFKLFNNNDFTAPCASGSNNYDSMIICPCSTGTLSRIANGISSDLISRTADVMLKEQRKLILVVRETPYNIIHIENMLKLAKAGAIIYPASPYFYNKPKTIHTLINQFVLRLLNKIDIPVNFDKWK